MLFLLLLIFLVLPDSFQFLRHHAGALCNVVAQMYLPAQRFEPFRQLPNLRPVCIGLFRAVPDGLGAQRLLERPTLGELAEETSHEKSGLWRTLQPLIREGLIETGAEGRAQRLNLSDQGMIALVRAMPMWREAQGRVDRVLGPRGRALVDLLSDVEARV